MATPAGGQAFWCHIGLTIKGEKGVIWGEVKMVCVMEVGCSKRVWSLE
jgi:hypothetical protein